MVPPFSHRISRVPCYSFKVRFGLISFTRLSLSSVESFQTIQLSYLFLNLIWALSISLAATCRIEFSFFSSGYLDVSVPRVPFHKLWIHLWMTVVHTAGFPHSEISGSKDICSSPKLIAAYHVFHRLSVPRHPPCALLRLTFVCPFPKKWLPPVPPSVENIRRMS